MSRREAVLLLLLLASSRVAACGSHSECGSIMRLPNVWIPLKDQHACKESYVVSHIRFTTVFGSPRDVMPPTQTNVPLHMRGTDKIE